MCFREVIRQKEKHNIKDTIDGSGNVIGLKYDEINTMKIKYGKKLTLYLTHKNPAYIKITRAASTLPPNGYYQLSI